MGERVGDPSLDSFIVANLDQRVPRSLNDNGKVKLENRLNCELSLINKENGRTSGFIGITQPTGRMSAKYRSPQVREQFCHWVATAVAD